MRAILTSFGTTGDILPFVALAAELRGHGHRVALALAPAFEGLARRHGLDFAPVGPDLAAAQAEINRAMIGGEGSPARLLELFAPLADALPRTFEDLRAACRGADVLVSGRIQLASRLVHDLTHVPYVTVHAEHSGAGGGAPGFQEAVRAVVNPLRERLGLSPMRNPLVEAASPQLVLHASSRHLRSLPAGAPAHHHLTGFLFLDEPAWAPDPALAAWMEEGAPPVAFTFGSMAPAEAAPLAELFARAAERAGRRAVVQVGAPVALPASARAVGFVPHGWLFPRAACAVHHGGAGTTGAALRAGVPQVVAPHAWDQLTWAELVQGAGCGAQVRRDGLTAEVLGDAIRSAVDGPARAAAAVLGEKVRAERGAAVAREHIEDLVRLVGLADQEDAEESPGRRAAPLRTRRGRAGALEQDT
jgi:sterol 3beta-glucosyltransferase